MSFSSFTRAPIWSRLFNVAMVIWYILAAIIIVSMMLERPWEITHGDYYLEPSGYDHWSSEAKAGSVAARSYWIWGSALLVATPWLFLVAMHILRNTAEFIVRKIGLGTSKAIERSKVSIESIHGLSEKRILEIDDAYYMRAGEEVAQNRQNPGLWYKSLTVADGDESKQVATYIRLRANQLHTDSAELPSNFVDMSQEGVATKETNFKPSYSSAYGVITLVFASIFLMLVISDNPPTTSSPTKANVAETVIFEFVSQELNVNPERPNFLDFKATVINRSLTSREFPTLNIKLFDSNGDLLKNLHFSPLEYLELGTSVAGGMKSETVYQISFSFMNSEMSAASYLVEMN